MTKRKKKNNDLFLSHYAVAFIDLLGQQEFLRNITLPDLNDPQDIENIRNQLKNTYGAVTGMRKFFNDSFNAFSKRRIDLSKLTPQQKREYETLSNNPIQFSTFSDSIVIYLSLRTDKMKFTYVK